MNGYELSRNFWDWSFEQPDKVKPIHSAIYFFSIEHCNRLGWKEKFGLPSQMVMEAIGVKNWKTYSAGLNDLVEFGFIKLIERSKNQYSSNIVAIVNFTKAPAEAPTKALDKALSGHDQKHSPKQGQSIVSIDKQQTINQEQETIPPTPKGEFDFNFDIYIDQINKLFGKNLRVVNDATKRSIKARLKEGYAKLDIWQAMQNVANDQWHKDNNYQYCTPQYFAQVKTLDMHSGKLNPSRDDGYKEYLLID